MPRRRDRYNILHHYGEVNFYLEDTYLDPEQARYILLKTVEQAIRDFISLKDSEITVEEKAWETANEFLFNDNYFISWGDLALNFDEILMIFDLDINWVREQIKRKANDVSSRK